MGWLFNWNKSFNKKSQVSEFLQGGFFTPDLTIVDHRVVGNNFWAVLQRNGQRFIWLAMMQPGGRDEGWGYKSMDETVEPNQLDCPLLLLKQCSLPLHGNAKKWRSDVRRWHENAAIARKVIVEVEAGMTLTSGEKSYIAIRTAGPRKGWVVQDRAGGLFRMPAQQLKRSIKEFVTKQPIFSAVNQTCLIF